MGLYRRLDRGLDMRTMDRFAARSCLSLSISCFTSASCCVCVCGGGGEGSEGKAQGEAYDWRGRDGGCLSRQVDAHLQGSVEGG